MDLLGQGGCISYATTGRKKIQACTFILKCWCEYKYFLRFKNIKQKIYHRYSCTITSVSYPGTKVWQFFAHLTVKSKFGFIYVY